MEEESRSMSWRPVGASIAAIAVLAAGIGGYYWYQRGSETPPSAPAPAPAPAPAATAPAAGVESEPQYPIDESGADHTTTLEQSDAALLDAIAHVQGWRASALQLLVPKDLVRHIVATVDGLTHEKLALQVLPTRPVPGLFQVAGTSKSATIAAANARRYDPYVQALTALDTEQLVAVYRHFYPLFAQAYRDLGYPKGYFNDRLVEVIDDLLEAPDPKPPIAVAAPRAMFHYSDSDLEALAIGQKILVRVGPAHESAIKAKLREIRQAVTTR